MISNKAKNKKSWEGKEGLHNYVSQNTLSLTVLTKISGYSISYTIISLYKRSISITITKILIDTTYLTKIILIKKLKYISKNSVQT